MKISRSSWHYKLNWIHKNSCSITLCAYFWELVFSVVVPISIIGLFSAACYTYFTDPGIFMLVNFIFFLVLCFILPCIVIHFVRKKFNGPVKLPKEDILKSYIRAKKEKICPILEYVD